MKSWIKHTDLIIAAFLGLVGLAGCERGAEVPEPLPAGTPEIEVTFSRATGDDAPDNGVLDDYFMDGRSVILISQRGDHISIDFNDYKTDSEGNTVENENLYKYVYYTNSSADWGNFFNFQPYGNRALDWAKMKENRLNGEYTLGALYYPVEYNIYNSVEADQSRYENVLRSNVLGAWHRTYQDQDRLRFRFWHLLAAFRVTLLIPDWDPEDNSGFGADAAEEAYLLNVRKDFTIDWPMASTEASPNAQYVEDSDPCDIRMYLESVDNDVISVGDITTSFPDVADERVRTATFVVLFPPQMLASPSMRFVLKTMGGMEKRYVWDAKTQIVDGTLKTDGGKIDNLILYLHRFDNNAILIKAHIMDWIDAESQFTVVPDDMD